MTEVFVDPYDIWNPKWSPLDFNSFKWIIKPDKLSPMNGEFKVAVDVAGFTATDDRLDVEVLLENKKHVLCIQGEHVDDDGRCFTRRNLLKLYRIDGECIPETLCVFIADDVLVARVLVDKDTKSPARQASLRDSVIRSESQTEMKQHRGRAPAMDRRHVSSISTAIKPVEQPEDRSVAHSVQLTQKTMNDRTVAPPSIHETASGDMAKSLSFRSDAIKTAMPSMPFESIVPSQVAELGVEQAELGAGRVERGMEGEVERGPAVVGETVEQKHMGISRRATGDIMKLMSKFTGQQEVIKQSPPIIKTQKHSEPTSPTFEPADTCVVHEPRRASVVTSIQPSVEKFAPDAGSIKEDDAQQDCLVAENLVDFTVTIPKTRSASATAQAGGAVASTESFSHPYEEVEECELEQKFLESHFSAAMNPDAGGKGQDILRVTLDVSDFRSNQLAMFIIGDEIVVNVEIARLVGSNKTLTKKFKLPANSDKANVRSLLTSEGLLQIDVPMLKRNEDSQMAPQPTDTILTTNF